MNDSPELQVVVDFLTDWRYCPLATSENPSRRCLADTAQQLLDVLPRPVQDEEREESMNIAWERYERRVTPWVRVPDDDPEANRKGRRACVRDG